MKFESYLKRGSVVVALVCGLQMACMPGPESGGCGGAEDGKADDVADVPPPPPPWGDIDDRCPPDDRMSTPFADYREPGPPVGDTGIMWTVDPSCPSSVDHEGGSLHYGVVDWDGEEREILINANSVSDRTSFQTTVTDISILDATNGELLTCIDVPDTPAKVEWDSVFNVDPPVLFMGYTGIQSYLDDPVSTHVGVVAIEIAPADSASVLFDKSWPSPVRAHYLANLTLTPAGLLGVDVFPTNESGATALGAFDARTGELYWDRPRQPGTRVAVTPNGGSLMTLYSAPDSADVESTRFNECGDVESEVDYSAFPLGDHFLGFVYDPELDGRKVVVYDQTGQEVLQTLCNEPVAVDEKTVACMKPGEGLQVIELDAERVTDADLPTRDSETGERLYYRERLIALQERKVLVVRRELEGRQPAQTFLAYHIDSGELEESSTIQSKDFSLAGRWAMSHRGVLYMAYNNEVSDARMMAIQTNIRPARSPWPFGLSMSPHNSIYNRVGNDNRGWIDVASQ